jgi:hypothetical protein
MGLCYRPSRAFTSGVRLYPSRLQRLGVRSLLGFHAAAISHSISSDSRMLLVVGQSVLPLEGTVAQGAPSI